MHTTVSVALNIPSSVKREMEISAFIHNLTENPRVKRNSQGIDQKENRGERYMQSLEKKEESGEITFNVSFPTICKRTDCEILVENITFFMIVECIKQVKFRYGVGFANNFSRIKIKI